LYSIYGCRFSSNIIYKYPQDIPWELTRSTPFHVKECESIVVDSSKINVLKYKNLTKPGFSGGLIVRCDDGAPVGIHKEGTPKILGDREGVLLFHIFQRLDLIGFCLKHLDKFCCKNNNKETFPESMPFNREELDERDKQYIKYKITKKKKKALLIWR